MPFLLSLICNPGWHIVKLTPVRERKPHDAGNHLLALGDHYVLEASAGGQFPSGVKTHCDSNYLQAARHRRGVVV
jgi:hypothetical protein